jgi:hypothetical protein
MDEQRGRQNVASYFCKILKQDGESERLILKKC